MTHFLDNEPLARYTSWRIGGSARHFADLASPEELRQALGWAQERDLPVELLGGGTNTLALDSGFNGLVLRYRATAVQIEERGETALVMLGAGAPMAGTVRRLARQGWGGLEWAEGLPGTIGGAVFGNAGCYGGDIASVLVRAWLLVDGQIEEWPAERFAFGYRTSTLKMMAYGRWTMDSSLVRSGTNDEALSSMVHRPSSSVNGPVPIVLAAELRIRRADPKELAERMEQTAAERRGKTPAGQSCGSVFKNPVGQSAGRLIEQAGLKGTRIGGAEIAQKHGNYIVNVGGASSDDVLRLVELARERVLQLFGVELELEVRLLGEERNDS
jgi:UDP-N-acetylmuramate dehydrogenase